jgi:ATP-dependent DNA helicase RecG
VDVPEIDPEAFREAIINAFCHRDYREYDSVNIAIFKDRLEIRSPGLLYGGLTVSDIRNKMVSIRRNELLADLFQRSHRIETWGRGIKMILEREPATEFEEVGTALFVARFWRRPAEPGSSEEGGKTTQKTTQKILDMIAANPSINRKELASQIGITTDGIKYHLTKLQKRGRLKRIGPDKGGHWEVSKD